MPRLLTLHIVRHVLGTTAVVALAMLAIYSFISLVTEADETGKGGFGVVQLLQTTLLQLPTGLALQMPIIAMIGALMGLGILSGQGELTAMRAAGFSVGKIAVATLLAGALLGAVGWLVSEVLAPAGERAADVVKARARGFESDGGKAVWLRDGDQVLRIRRLLAEDRAEGVEIYRLGPDFRLSQVLAADAAEYRDGRWLLSGVRETRLLEAGRAETARQTRSEWRGAVTPNVLKLYVLEAQAISVGGLRRLIGYLDENRLDAQQYRLQLWRKLIEPLTVMAMALFAVPFAFGGLRDSGAGQRLLIGILLGVGFYVVNRVSLSLGQIYGWPPLLAAGTPTLAWALLGCWRISRLR
jgi:lipopolysaccharide export system permease protein